MVNPWWSIVLALLGITSMVLAGNKLKSAWVIGLISQVIWITYGFITNQWGFVLSGVAFSIVYVRNLLLWHAEEKEA